MEFSSIRFEPSAAECRASLWSKRINLLDNKKLELLLGASFRARQLLTWLDALEALGGLTAADLHRMCHLDQVRKYY